MWRESGGSLIDLGTFYRESGGSLVEIGAIYRESGGVLTQVWPLVAPETLRPVSDVSTDVWTDATGGDDNGDIWDEIDEASPDDDTTYVSLLSTGSAVTSHFEVHLTNPSENHDSSQTHTIRARGRYSGDGGNAQLRVELWQGGTKIAESSLDNMSGTWQTVSYTLTSTEAGNITDYSDLRIKVEGQVDDDGTSPFSNALCTWAELEIS